MLEFDARVVGRGLQRDHDWAESSNSMSSFDFRSANNFFAILVRHLVPSAGVTGGIILLPGAIISKSWAASTGLGSADVEQKTPDLYKNLSQLM
jgi:hypothetical protein